MNEDFSSKWGLQKSTLSSHNIYGLVAAQIVVIAVILCLIRPKFILYCKSRMHVGNVSLCRVLATSILIAGLTYFYPSIV